MNQRIRTSVVTCLAVWHCLALVATAHNDTTSAIVSGQKVETGQHDSAEAQDDFDFRNKLTERLFKFHDARVRVSDSGSYVWVTKTGDSPERPAEIWIMELANDFSKLKSRHHFKLLNPVAPTGQYMTSDGKYFVTLDEAGRCGNSPRDLVIYDLEQGTSLAHGIEEFLPKPIVNSLKGPVYMGGSGLRQWQRLGQGKNKYDPTTEKFYPTRPRLAKTTSRTPFLSIHLPSGKVQVEPVPEDDSGLQTPDQDRLIPRNVQTDWAMADGSREIPADSKDPVEYIGIVQPRVDNKNDKPLRLAFKHDSKTGNYLPIDWDKFIEQTDSKLKTIED